MDPSIRAMFHPASGLTYLDTATYGLPPDPTLLAMRAAEEAWQSGTGVWVEWDREAERARAAFGRLIGAAAARVALMPGVSVGVGLVAADLKPGDRVVMPAAEFTSVMFPLLVARERGVEIVEVDDIDRLADAITPGTTLVALSLVQMQTGRVLPVAEIVERAEAVGAQVLLDATHGVPFVPLGDVIDRIDYVVVAAYKHLLCPRGVAFLAVREDHIGRLPPIFSNWRSSDAPYSHFFGGPLALAGGAAQYDVSFGWITWIGAAASLELLVDWQAAGALDESVALARDLAGRLEIPWGGGTLVCPPIDDPDRVRAALAEHRLKAAFRGTALRLSTHVYNDTADIDRAAAIVAPLLAHRVSA
ncbi:MAG: aminotransferase class V-fold PLP-dependent enzyme [Chloroflexi bacterium]|nr:aminotransferase class V-fold PLP-dependent enzyme [Chloroflexota bacterium]